MIPWCFFFFRRRLWCRKCARLRKARPATGLLLGVVSGLMVVKCTFVDSRPWYMLPLPIYSCMLLSNKIQLTEDDILPPWFDWFPVESCSQLGWHQKHQGFDLSVLNDVDQSDCTDTWQNTIVVQQIVSWFLQGGTHKQLTQQKFNWWSSITCQATHVPFLPNPRKPLWMLALQIIIRKHPKTVSGEFRVPIKS